MNVVLVNPPKSHYDVEELAPPLGLLRLARVAHELDARVHVEDYNLLWHLDAQLRSSFYDAATERLVGLEGDIYGFTSMAVDSHVALELARRVKQQRPESFIVLGGTHFSSIAETLPSAFPWVDMVVRGEGEGVFAALLRERTGRPRLPVPSSSIARPLYDVVRFPAYFHVNPRHMVNLEAGRGCRFQCTFCYSPAHYQAVRDFPIESVVEELAALPALGVQHVWFVEDNFLNDPKRALSLCHAIQDARLELHWSCYATFPQLTEPLVHAMARAGCTEVFSGIDAIGTSSERTFHKAFLRGKTTLELKTRWMVDAGIMPTYAFLLSPPSHPAGVNLNVTACTALEARLCGAETLLNPLTLYSKTRAQAAYAPEYAADGLQVRLMMDVPDVVADNPFAASHPEMFPFHARYVDEREWHDFLKLSHCLSTLINTYPKTMASLLSARGTDPVQVAEKTLERFADWSRLKSMERRQFEQDAGFFVLEQLALGSPAASVLEDERTSIAVEY
jgi:hypothetical protein